MRNEPVGSTCTIVTSMFQERGVMPSPKLAGLLAAGIIADTILFRSPTSTDKDRVMAERMARRAGLSLEALGQEIFSASAPEFTPADLGMKDGWRANLRSGDHYWFDVKVDPGSVTDAYGNTVSLATPASYDGSADSDEQFVILYTESSYSTKAAGTFSRPGGTTAVHDDITLDFDEVKTLNVTSTLNWAADAKATKADASKSKAATLKAKATSAGPSFTPADFGWKTWRAGKYWYDLVIPAQTGNPEGRQLPGLQSSQTGPCI